MSPTGWWSSATGSCSSSRRASELGSSLPGQTVIGGLGRRLSRPPAAPPSPNRASVSPSRLTTGRLPPPLGSVPAVRVLGRLDDQELAAAPRLSAPPRPPR